MRSLQLSSWSNDGSWDIDGMDEGQNLTVFVLELKRTKLGELGQIVENLDYQGQDLSMETVGSAQNKNSLLHFCSCDLALVFNRGWSFLSFLWAHLGGALD